MKKVHFLFLFCCLFSSASLSDTYEQRYQTGDIGPNGGVVTGVVVDSQLVDTTIEMVGDFEEFTYTYEYIETITEDVQQSEQVTTTTVTSVTSPNVIPTEGEFNDTNINIVGPQGNAYGMSGAEFTTGNEATGGGTRIYEGVLPVENAEQIDYGATVYSHSSNSFVPDCGNTTSDCRDDFSITVSLYNEGELIETRTHLYEGITWTGSREYDYSLDVSELTFDYGSMSLYGIDRGYNSGYFGPGFSDIYATVTYNVIEQVVNTIVSTVEMQTVETSNVYVYDSIYHPPVIDVQIEPITETAFEVEVVQVDNFGVESVEVFEVELDIEVAEQPAVLEIAEVEEFDTPVTEPEVEEVEVVVEEVQEEVQESSEDVDEPVEVADKPKVEEPASKAEVRKDTSSSKPQSYSIALDSVKVALMVQNETSRIFTTYRQQTVPDVPFYSPVAIDGGETVDNPIGRWMTGASEALMEEMVESQWQK